ncbi:MAG: hypothetical protein OHK0017_11070 [Patescibacteria group bacterium]
MQLDSEKVDLNQISSQSKVLLDLKEKTELLQVSQREFPNLNLPDAWLAILYMNQISNRGELSSEITPMQVELSQILRYRLNGLGIDQITELVYKDIRITFGREQIYPKLARIYNYLPFGSDIFFLVNPGSNYFRLTGDVIDIKSRFERKIVAFQRCWSSEHLNKLEAYISPLFWKLNLSRISSLGLRLQGYTPEEIANMLPSLGLCANFPARSSIMNYIESGYDAMNEIGLDASKSHILQLPEGSGIDWSPIFEYEQKLHQIKQVVLNQDAELVLFIKEMVSQNLFRFNLAFQARLAGKNYQQIANKMGLQQPKQTVQNQYLGLVYKKIEQTNSELILNLIEHHQYLKIESEVGLEQIENIDLHQFEKKILVARNFINYFNDPKNHELLLTLFCQCNAYQFKIICKFIENPKCLELDFSANNFNRIDELRQVWELYYIMDSVDLDLVHQMLSTAVQNTPKPVQEFMQICTEVKLTYDQILLLFINVFPSESIGLKAQLGFNPQKIKDLKKKIQFKFNQLNHMNFLEDKTDLFTYSKIVSMLIRRIYRKS